MDRAGKHPLKSLLAGMFRPIGRIGETLLDRLLCVAGAVTLAQAPEFFQQYLQRVGGHLDEARRQLARYEQVARETGVTLQGLIDTAREQTAAPVVKLGDVIAETQARVADLEAAEIALRTATDWERPFVFLRVLDASIAARTWEVFKPAVPVTLEGMAYALAGMILALAVYHLTLAWPLRSWLRQRRARPDQLKQPSTSS